MPAVLASSNFNHWGCNGDGACPKTSSMALVPVFIVVVFTYSTYSLSIQAVIFDITWWLFLLLSMS